MPAANVEREGRGERSGRVDGVERKVAEEPDGGIVVLVDTEGRVEQRTRDARGERGDCVGRVVLAPDLEQPALAEDDDLFDDEREEREAEDAEADVRQIRAVDLRGQTGS